MNTRTLFTLLLLAVFGQLKSQQSSPHAYARFIENKGQWPFAVHHMAKLNGGELWMDETGATFHFIHPDDIEKMEEAHHGHVHIGPNDKMREHVYRMKFIRNPLAKIVSAKAENDYVNYYIGNDPSKWVNHASVNREMTIYDAVPGIDYIFYSTEGLLKYDIRIHPNADLKELYVEYDGAEKLYLKNGDLHIVLSTGEVIEKSPIASQGDKNVGVKFRLDGKRVYFDLGKYDNTKDVLIDPTLIFSTYSGSTADNWGYSATYDNSGNLYSGSIAFAFGYPTTAGAFLTSYSGASTHAAITKFNNIGSSLVFSTYLGGSGADAPHSLVVDDNDNLIVMGTTTSSDFPTTGGAYDVTFNGGTSVTVNSLVNYTSGSDIFVTKFNTTGTALVGSTFVGGTANDGLNLDITLNLNYGDESRGEVVVDTSGNIYVCSSTLSSTFPTTPGAFSTTLTALQEGCAFKLNPTLTTLMWSTYLGGSNADGAYSLKPASNGRVYVTGGTRSTNFPTTAGTLITSAPGGTVDGFIVALDNSNGAGIASTYLGTTSYDQGYLIDLNIDNEVFVVGQTKGAYPVSAGVYSNAGGKQFIHKLNPDLTATMFSTIFGSGAATINISPTALLVDNCENIYVSGWGGSVNAEGSTTGLPVTADAYDAATDGSDFYFIVLERDAGALLYGSFFGAGTLAEHVDGGTSRFDKAGTIYQAVCAGCGSSDLFPTTPGVWSNLNGSSNCNLGAIKMEFVYTGIEAVANASPNIIACDPPYDVNFTGSASAVDHVWDFGDGTGTSTLMNPSHTFADTGSFTIMYIAIDSSTCNIADTAYLSVVILEAEEFSASIVVPPYNPCDTVPLTINLDFTGTGADYLSWDMGDGTVYTNDTSITHTYIASGTYIVTMYAYDSTCALSGTITDTIVYNMNYLTVDAEASPNVFACDPPYTVNFSNGGNTAPDHFWDFDDGNTSFLGNPSYTFTDTGTFNIMYVAIDSATCNVSDTSYVTVQILQAEVFAADIDIPPYDPCTGGPLTVTLDFTGSGADSLVWDMGDGTIYVNDFNVVHTYTIPGTYIVEMFAYDTVCGVSGTVTDTVVYNPTYIAVTADASPDVFTCDPPYTVTFDNGGNTAPQHFWDFDNGDTSPLPTPTYTFTTTGTFNVMYIATDSSTCNISDTAYATITILEAEEFDATFAFTPPPPCTDTMLVSLAFTGTGADSLVWDMGDGTIFTDLSAVNWFYITPGSYTVTLTAYDFTCSKIESISSTFVKDEPVQDGDVIVPNIFTPNGDGSNDKFYVGYEGIPVETSMEDMEIYEVKVFNRWGTLLFDNGGSSSSWDGKFNGNPVDEGVYFYLVRYKRVCGDEDVIEKHGHVTIVR